MVDLKQKRKEKNISVDKLSKDVGVTRQHIYHIEKGLAVPSIAVAKKIAAILNFDWTEFYK